jgi:hypothetical protein
MEGYGVVRGALPTIARSVGIYTALSAWAPAVLVQPYSMHAALEGFAMVFGADPDFFTILVAYALLV